MPITTHGLSSHPIYNVWAGMKTRCYNPNYQQWKDWGGRGIRVCAEWRESPKAFIEWALENGYKKGLTIDRKENDGDYTPDNCRFIIRAENGRNNRQTKLNWDAATTIRKIRMDYPEITHKELAAFYKVHRTTIGDVLKNKTWNH